MANDFQDAATCLLPLDSKRELLDIEARIGELLPSQKEAIKLGGSRGGKEVPGRALLC
jgi:hypothetical protein